MASVLGDENVPIRVVEELRRLGHDVLTLTQVNLANVGAPDDDVLSQGARLGRIVLTLNRRDFVRLHESGAPHVGMVVASVDRDPIQLAQRVHRALELSLPGERVLVRVNRQG